MKNSRLPAFSAMVIAMAAWGALAHWNREIVPGVSGTPGDPGFTNNTSERMEARWALMPPSTRHLYVEYSNAKTGEIVQVGSEGRFFPRTSDDSELALDVRVKYAADPGHYIGAAKLGNFSVAQGVEPAQVEMQIDPSSIDPIKTTPIEGGVRLSMKAKEPGSGIWVYPANVKVSDKNEKIAVMRAGSVPMEIYKRLEKQEVVEDWVFAGEVVSALISVGSIFLLIGMTIEKRLTKAEMKRANGLMRR